MRKFDRSTVREIVGEMLEVFRLDTEASAAHDLGRSEDSVAFMMLAHVRSEEIQNRCNKVQGLASYCVTAAVRLQEYQKRKRLSDAIKRLSEVS